MQRFERQGRRSVRELAAQDTAALLGDRALSPFASVRGALCDFGSSFDLFDPASSFQQPGMLRAVSARVALPISAENAYNSRRFGGHLGSPIKAAEPRPKGFRENSNMQISHRARVGLIALVAMVGASISSAASADSGIVRISVVKGGWFIGANGGWGTLIFHGRRYPLSVGGVDAGLVFGLSQTTLVGRVINIRGPSDVAGVYVAAGAGAAVGIGARLIQLSNDKGAVLQLEGRQIGLIANLDLSGLAIALR